jgi:hypothetical protein
VKISTVTPPGQRRGGMKPRREDRLERRRDAMVGVLAHVGRLPPAREAIEELGVAKRSLASTSGEPRSER